MGVLKMPHTSLVVEIRSGQASLAEADGVRLGTRSLKSYDLLSRSDVPCNLMGLD